MDRRLLLPGILRGRTGVALLGLVVVAAAAFLFFHRLGAAPLYGDEAIHAQVARESAERDAWLPPTFEGRPYTAKPPLKILAVAWIFDRFGVGAMQARVLDAAFGVATVLAVFLLGVRLFDAWTGLLAALLLATDRLYVLRHGVREGVQDSALVFFFTVALGLYLLHLEGGRRRRLAVVGAGLALGTASLIKGAPAALALPVIAAWELAVGRRVGARWVGVADLAIVTLVSLAFYGPYVAAAMAWTGGDFFGRLHDDVVVRATESLDPSHVHGPWFYFRQLGRELGPWLLATVPALAVIVRPEEGERTRRAIVLLGLWALVPLALLSLSASKLEWYLYPAYPALVLLVAAGVGFAVRWAAARGAPGRLGRGVAAVLVVAAVAGLVVRFDGLRRRLDEQRPEPLVVRYARVMAELPSVRVAILEDAGLPSWQVFHLAPYSWRVWRVPAVFESEDQEPCRFLVRSHPGIPPRARPGPRARALPLRWPDPQAWLVDLDGCLPSWV